MTDPFLKELLKWLARDNWSYFDDEFTPLKIHFVVNGVEPAFRVKGEIISPRMYIENRRAENNGYIPDGFYSQLRQAAADQDADYDYVYMQNAAILWQDRDWEKLNGPFKIPLKLACCTNGW